MQNIQPIGIRCSEKTRKENSMRDETISKMKNFNLSEETDIVMSDSYKVFEPYIKQIVSGEGMIGESNYLMIWEKGDMEELNDDYETREFLNDIILIGSDGGDTAYGVDVQGRFIEVPFIGMEDDEVKVIANDFDEFINYVWSKE